MFYHPEELKLSSDLLDNSSPAPPPWGASSSPEVCVFVCMRERETSSTIGVYVCEREGVCMREREGGREGEEKENARARERSSSDHKTPATSN